ncbi:protease inhibitor I42 family protein [Lysinibacillus fusiformis]|uniref:ImmA/IrrE family metallo-endopeptidase n=1 Tax=Lysinibacillus fusiformis TaxID=28031 RepID=UPI002D7A3BC8|nr:protease inhibitor I42 family protein [Lysinibacillus fusiformis]WRS98585.1 protease inhibitor I42 family protein [Lysinibacillus fusiformis]
MVKPWAAIIQEATLEAGREHIRNKTDYKRAIDIFSIIESKNIVLMFQPLGALAAAYLPAKEGRPAGILINEKLPITKQRYSAAHEYCHFLKNDAESLDTEEDMFDFTKYRANDSERIAESFAGIFLMPRKLVRNLIKLLNITEFNPENVYTLSLRLGTSYSATVIRLLDLKMIDHQQYKILSIKPKSIKSSLGNNGLDTAWNDVWKLYKRDNNNTLFPRVGDLLLLELEENPSTGYIWSNNHVQGIEIIEHKWTSNSGIGSGGQRHIKFKITDHVFTDIKLVYTRPWKEDDVLDSISFNIKTEEKRHGVNYTLLTG